MQLVYMRPIIAWTSRFVWDLQSAHEPCLKTNAQDRPRWVHRAKTLWNQGVGLSPNDIIIISSNNCKSSRSSVSPTRARVPLNGCLAHTPAHTHMPTHTFTHTQTHTHTHTMRGIKSSPVQPSSRTWAHRAPTNRPTRRSPTPAGSPVRCSRAYRRMC